ncbi:MAG: Rnf-Nqr domain containing protein [Brevinema sp.]
MNYAKLFENIIEVFMEGAMFYNLLTFHAIGLGMFILFSYTLKESLWVSLRFTLFLMIQTLIMLIVTPYFNTPSKEIFILLFLLSTELMVSILMDRLLPKSIIKSGVRGFTKRGDAIIPIVLATIMTYRFNPVETVVYSLGAGIGFSIILIGMSAIAIKFSFHRFSESQVYIYKFFILGVLAMIFG